MPLRRLLALLAFLGLPTALLGAQDATDVIRGRVTGPDSQPVIGVTVSAQSMVTQTTRSTRTGRDGRYTILFPGGGGDYLVSVVQLGFSPARFEVQRTGDEAVLVADARLSRMPQMLDAVKVLAGRQRPGRNDGSPDVGGAERDIGADVPLDKMGDLAEMAASIPGVSLIPGEDGGISGFSILGLGADQNSVTLNGMAFDGGSIPRDAMTMTRLSTSTFDPARGGFSGAQLAMRTAGGSNFIQRSLHLSYDQPSLQWTDRVGAQLGQQFTNYVASGNVSGPIVADRAFYNLSFQGGRRANDLQTLLNTDAYALERAGIARDSVQRLLGDLVTAGVPVSAVGIPGARVNESGSLLGGVEFQPSGGQHFGVTANARWNRADAAMLGATTVPAHGGDTEGWGGQVQVKHSGYFGSGILNELTAAASTSVSSGDPYVALPDARVRVGSTFANGTAGYSTLQFGGNNGLPRRATNGGWQVHDEASWITWDNRHRIQLTGDARLDRYAQDQSYNRLGTFWYNSLADLEAGRPSSFSRRLDASHRDGSEVTTALSLGDRWRATPALQLQYGLRLEANRFSSMPVENPAVESAFGLRNDRVPDEVHLSPRLGFQWNYGTAPQIAGFAGAARVPRGQLRGGVGEFHNVPGAGLIGGAIDNTGLPSGARQLSCIGAAVPTPDWSTWTRDPSEVPTQCADGSSGTVFSSTLPNVVLFDPDFRFSRSWRANVGWNGQLPMIRRLRGGAEATYSLNYGQQGWVDLNFDDRVRFVLPAEGDRPVFVAPTSIVPTSGAIAARDARRAATFGTVSLQRSDLRSVSRQLSLNISPVAYNSRFGWSLTYLWQQVRDLRRGFGGNTAGDPLDMQWARAGGDWRHQITYSLRYNVADAVNLSLFGRVQAGTPYTPMVAGDVNGDGSGNDRAFVFDPAAADAAGDTSLGRSMRALLTGAPAAVRQCLERQLGHVASRNSCETPWSTSMSARIGLVSRALHLPQRAAVSINFANPLTGIDALVHGGDHLHGWGQTPYADPTLLYVRGFDPGSGSGAGPQAQRFRYDVNPRFGDTRPTSTAVRAPFFVTLDVRINVGPEMDRQMLNQVLTAGRTRQGERMQVDQIKQRYARSLSNAFDQILRQKDSLHLTFFQTDTILRYKKRFEEETDRIWTPVAQRLAALGETFDLDEEYARVRAAQNASYDALAHWGPLVKRTLTADQLRQLPPFVAAFLDETSIQRMRPEGRF